jgi:hypothetical protein
MKKLNQQGIAGTLVILIIVLLLAVGGVGYYVWKMRSDSKPAGDATGHSSHMTESKTVEKTAPDPTADWATYSNKEGSFSFKYPKTWVQAAHPEKCNPGSVLFGVNAASVGTCASGNGGQMSFSTQAGDVVSTAKMQNASYPDVTSTAVTINGVAGTKQAGTYKDVDGFGVGPTEGTKLTQYTFFTGGKTYVATYSVGNPASPYPDGLSDFNTLMTTTFKFTP